MQGGKWFRVHDVLPVARVRVHLAPGRYCRYTVAILNFEL